MPLENVGSLQIMEKVGPIPIIDGVEAGTKQPQSHQPRL